MSILSDMIDAWNSIPQPPRGAMRWRILHRLPGFYVPASSTLKSGAPLNVNPVGYDRRMEQHPSAAARRYAVADFAQIAGVPCPSVKYIEVRRAAQCQSCRI